MNTMLEEKLNTTVSCQCKHCGKKSKFTSAVKYSWTDRKEGAPQTGYVVNCPDCGSRLLLNGIPSQPGAGNNTGKGGKPGNDVIGDPPGKPVLKIVLVALCVVFVVILLVKLLIGNSGGNSSENTGESNTGGSSSTTTVTTVVADIDIPDSGTLSYGGHTYFVFDPSIQTEIGNIDTWEEAKEYCESLGGHLAIIDDAEENDALYAFCTETRGYERVFFGLSDSVEEGTWTWVDGTDADEGLYYVNWSDDQPNAKADDEDYGQFWMSGEPGEWNDAAYGSGMRAFLCEWDVDVGEQAPYQYTDSAIAIKEIDGHTYAIYDPDNTSGMDNVDSWEDAKEYCARCGGHLVIINSASENQEVYQFLVDNYYQNAFIGLSDADEEGVWKWVDGSYISAAAAFWGPEEPNSDTSKEDYAQYYYQFGDGSWNDSEFGYNDIDTFICEWEF